MRREREREPTHLALAALEAGVVLSSDADQITLLDVGDLGANLDGNSNNFVTDDLCGKSCKSVRASKRARRGYKSRAWGYSCFGFHPASAVCKSLAQTPLRGPEIASVGSWGGGRERETWATRTSANQRLTTVEL